MTPPVHAIAWSATALISAIDMLSAQARKILIDVAEEAVAYGLREHSELLLLLDNYPQELKYPGASFVTLKIDHILRGCIGCLEAHQALVQDVAHNAYAAAFKDPRFKPVNADELPLLQYHISILTPPTRMSFSDEADLLGQIQPGVDGLVLEDGFHRGTFLPAVWESLADTQQFLKQLKMKAGLPADYWSDKIKVSRYAVEEFGRD